MKRSLLFILLLLPGIVSAQFRVDTVQLQNAAYITGEAELEVSADTIVANLRISGPIYEDAYQEAVNALCDRILTALKVKELVQNSSEDIEPGTFTRRYTIPFSSLKEYNAFALAAEQYPKEHNIEIAARVRYAGLKPATYEAALAKVYTMALENAKAKIATISKVYGVQPGQILAIHENYVPDRDKLREKKNKKPSELTESEIMEILYAEIQRKENKRRKRANKKTQAVVLSTRVHVVYSLK